MESIKLYDGKYEVLHSSKANEPFVFKALRYGEEWRNLTGDNLILAMFHKIQELEEKITELKEDNEILKSNLSID